jgi:hypothetical protein
MVASLKSQQYDQTNGEQSEEFLKSLSRMSRHADHVTGFVIAQSLFFSRPTLSSDPPPPEYPDDFTIYFGYTGERLLATGGIR